MRLRKCHIKDCGGTFTSVDGRRKLCDTCRAACKRYRNNPNPRAWRRLKPGMDIKRYKRLRRLLDYEHYPFKSPEAQKKAKERADWARQVLYGEMSETKLYEPKPKPNSYSNAIQ